MIHKATKLIARGMKEIGLPCMIEERKDVSSVVMPLPLRGGPTVMLRYVSDDGENDVSMVVLGFLNDVPPDCRGQVMAECNRLNDTVRFLKFAMSSRGDVSVYGDFYSSVPDECLAEQALEALRCFKLILEQEGLVLLEIVRGKEPRDPEYEAFLAWQKRLEVRRKLEERLASLEEARAGEDPEETDWEEGSWDEEDEADEDEEDEDEDEAEDEADGSDEPLAGYVFRPEPVLLPDWLRDEEDPPF